MVDHSSDKVAHIHQELHSHLPAEPALRTKALESLLREQGRVDPATVAAWVDAHAETIGPKNGAKVIARSWLDPEFKAHLLEDAGAAIEELGLLQGHLTAVENTDDVHNLVVCTLCSCYPMGPWGWHRLGTNGCTVARRSRTAQGLGRIWRSTFTGHPCSSLGQHCGASLSCHSTAPRWHRGLG